MEQSPWEANGRSLFKKFTAFYGTPSFITVFTRTRHWSLSWATWIQFTPSHPIYLRSILILSSHVRLRLPSGVFEADHSPPSIAEVKNAWSHTSTLPYVFMAWYLVKHRNFTFTFTFVSQVDNYPQLSQRGCIYDAVCCMTQHYTASQPRRILLETSLSWRP
jgi:hypothetical protein